MEIARLIFSFVQVRNPIAAWQTIEHAQKVFVPEYFFSNIHFWPCGRKAAMANHLGDMTC